MRRSFLFVMALALVACGGKVFVDVPTGGSGGSAAGGAPSTGSFGEGASAAGGATTSCFACACENLLSQGGCADICTMGLNGTTNPNFCDGSAVLTQCAACIISTCGVADPYQCTM